MSATERRGVVTRAVIISLAVTIFFVLAGRAVLAHLGVTVHAFGISGGILLFASALPLLFGQRPGLQAPERDEHGTGGEDIAIFPLAIPLLSGPGTIATVRLLSTQTGGAASSLAALAAAIVMVYLIALLVLRAGDWLMARVGEGKVHILTRVMGIILAELAVQYVLNGVTGYYTSLTTR